MFNYQQLIEEFEIKSIEELNNIFIEEIAHDWAQTYREMSIHGVITLQNFCGYTFIIDDGNQLISHNASSKNNILESRVVSAFGISTTNIMHGNRKMMRKWIGKTSEIFCVYGNNYDKGHFIAHGIGGPIDVNLFPQRRDINRGWSIEGVEFRRMERFVASKPGTFVFSRPIYSDSSFCPAIIEFGYCDVTLRFNVKQFPNR